MLAERSTALQLMWGLPRSFSSRGDDLALEALLSCQRSIQFVRKALLVKVLVPRRAESLSSARSTGSIALPRDRGEHEKGAADCAEEQAHYPKPAFSCECGDCSDGNRDLKHGHTAREYFVLVKI